jgi:hypothetical protein
VAQISGVGTLPAYRRRGVNRELTRVGLQWADREHEGVFLFSTEEAISYYTRCGYTPLDEHLPTLPIQPVSKRRGAVRLNTGNEHDLRRIYEYAQKTDSVSDRFAVMSPRLFMFHAMYTLQEKIWEIPELDCLVCFARDDHGLQIYDILGKSIPTFEKLYPYIAEETDRMAGFHFYADRLDLDGAGRREIFGNNLFVKPEFPVHDPVFPYTARA